MPDAEQDSDLQANYSGDEAIRLLKEILALPKKDWPKRMIVSVFGNDIQLYIRKRADGTVELPPLPDMDGGFDAGCPAPDPIA